MLSTIILLGLGPMSLWSGLVSAAPADADAESRRPPASCHTPENRCCWTKDFDINTDWEVKTPNTGVVRRYNLTITEEDNYVGADGVTKVKAMLINGQFPGPTLYADWGDTMEVTVFNKVRTNGTGIHWHGVRMLNNCMNDGAPGVTECPLPPGKEKKYTFRVTQYGTSWYHTHFSSQYAYGVAGNLVFNGPAAAPYDIDLGPFPISDWYYQGVDEIVAGLLTPATGGRAPPSDNVFLNGTNINPKGPGGKYAVVTLTPGKTHRLRLINPSVDNTFQVSIQGHNMTAIQSDFVPIKPIITDTLFMGIGQRYDVLLTAPKDKVGNFWINVTYSGAGACSTSNNPNVAAILRYKGAPDELLPKEQGTKPPDTLCADRHDLEPIVKRIAPIETFQPNNYTNIDIQLNVTTTSVFWDVNGGPINVTWAKPTLEMIHENNSSFPEESNIIRINKRSKWSFWIIHNLSRIAHPMHLHGHDFLLLGASTPFEKPLNATLTPARAIFNPATDMSKLKATNPTRRDATMLPAFGWLVVAFANDNPGAWLFHCHISWHASQGLVTQFLEREDEIPKNMDLSSITDTCKQWREYFPTSPHHQIDSGL